VADSDGFNVSVISTATNTVVATVTVASRPVAVDITPNGAFAYVSLDSDKVVVIATATNTVVATVTVGFFPRFMAIDPTGAFAYVPVFSFASTVSVIDTATNTVVATFSTGAGAGPFAIAFAVRTQGPTNKDQCKNGGWENFTNPTFKNQGQCIKFVNHMNEGND
jgi:YVTN family beta-propeller protein